MMTKKITTADLMRELDALKKEVAALKAAPKSEQHYHYHYPQQPATTWYPPLQPYRYVPTPFTPTYPGITWGTTAVPCTTATITRDNVMAGYAQTVAK